MKKRKYTQRQRAEQQELTRARIVEAAMELHEQLGPANTSIKAVAEKAGVQRLTVYRHFPDESSLFQACTSHWAQLHPPPQQFQWSDIEGIEERTRSVLLLFYRYYSSTERMWRVSYRDVEFVQALQAPMSEFESSLDKIADELASAWNPGQIHIKALRFTLRHGLAFHTWSSLQRQSLADVEKVNLVEFWLQGMVSPNQ